MDTKITLVAALAFGAVLIALFLPLVHVMAQHKVSKKTDPGVTWDSGKDVGERVETEPIVWVGITWHHSGTPDGDVDAFRRYHMAKGWDDVGYHYVIKIDGTVQPGRPLTMRGAHSGDSRNGTHIGVCIVGDGTYTHAQERAANALRAILIKRFPITRMDRHALWCPGGVFTFDENDPTKPIRFAPQKKTEVTRHA